MRNFSVSSPLQPLLRNGRASLTLKCWIERKGHFDKSTKSRSSMSSTKQSTESEYEIAYRSTIQPRTAVRTQSRQSGSYSSGAVSGGGGKEFLLTKIKLRKRTDDAANAWQCGDGTIMFFAHSFGLCLKLIVFLRKFHVECERWLAVIPREDMLSTSKIRKLIAGKMRTFRIFNFHSWIFHCRIWIIRVILSARLLSTASGLLYFE